MRVIVFNIFLFLIFLLLIFKNNTFSEILTKAPGCQESVIFAKDGYTLLDKAEQEKEENTTNEVEDIQININLEDVVHNNAYLVGNLM